MDRPVVHLPSVVARLGETEYPEAYGGLVVRRSGAGALTMTIYVVAAQAEPFLAAVREQSSRSPAAEYTVVRVPHTWAELDALAQTIEAAKDNWRARGIRLGTAEPDAATSKVIVTLADYRPSAASAVTAAYGDDWISVVPSPARYFPLEGLTSATSIWFGHSIQAAGVSLYLTAGPRPTSALLRFAQQSGVRP